MGRRFPKGRSSRRPVTRRQDQKGPGADGRLFETDSCLRFLSLPRLVVLERAWVQILPEEPFPSDSEPGKHRRRRGLGNSWYDGVTSGFQTRTGGPFEMSAFYTWTDARDETRGTESRSWRCSFEKKAEVKKAGRRHRGRLFLRCALEGDLPVGRCLAGELDLEIGLDRSGGGGFLGQAGSDGEHRELAPADGLHHVDVEVAVAGIERLDGDGAAPSITASRGKPVFRRRARWRGG